MMYQESAVLWEYSKYWNKLTSSKKIKLFFLGLHVLGREEDKIKGSNRINKRMRKIIPINDKCYENKVK